MLRYFVSVVALAAAGSTSAKPPPSAIIARTPPPAPAATPARKPDLADAAAGEWYGDVISDARGSSRSGVKIIITRVGPNKIHVESSYKRLPPFDVRLQRVMATVQNVDGSQVFLIENAKSPVTLSITNDDASWSGTR